MSLIERAAERFGAPDAPRSLLERAEAQGLFAGPRSPSLPLPGPEPEPPQGPRFAAATPPTPVEGARAFDRAKLAEAGYDLSWDPRSRLAEEMRVIVRRLCDSRSRPASIMVTSSRPGEGKTFFALNLALALARDDGRRVVLVDADLRMRALTRALGLASEPGVADVLGGASAAERAVLALDGLPMEVLPAGSVPQDGPTVSEPQLRRLAEETAARLPDRVVIFDTPPLLSATEPILISPYVDRIVLVVEADRTPQRTVEAALDLLSSTERVSMVLNRAPAFGAEESFGSYYGAGRAGEPVPS